MAISIDFTDFDGFLWDLRAGDGGGLSVENGTIDAFDGGMQLSVGGALALHDDAFESSRPGALETEVLEMSGLLVSRRFQLVTDSEDRAAARFIESFHNPTDAPITVEVRIATNLGSDVDTDLRVGNAVEDVLIGLATDDGPVDGVGDPMVLLAYGGQGGAAVLPDAVTLDRDNVAAGYTLTVAPGETQRLLHFAAQTQTQSRAGDRLLELSGADSAPGGGIALTGLSSSLVGDLSRQELREIVNYDADAAFTSEVWFDDFLRATTLDPATGAFGFDQPIEWSWFQTVLEASLTDAVVDAERRTATFTFEEDDGDGVYEIELFAPRAGGFVRMVQTWTSPSGQPAIFDLTPVDAADDAGHRIVHTIGAEASPSALVAVEFDGERVGFKSPMGIVLGDASMPTLDIAPLDGFLEMTEVALMPAGATSVSWMSFFYEYASVADAVAGITALSSPGPEALAFLDDADLAALRNFDLSASDRLERVEGTGGGDVLEADADHAFRFNGKGGDDEIIGGASADVMLGGGGEDAIVGLDGADQVKGGGGGDFVLGGRGDDSLDGGGGGDELRGGVGDDILKGGGGADLIRGGLGDDLIFDGGGKDVLGGGAGANVFTLANDGNLDRIVKFDVGVEQIAFSGGRFRDLKIKDVKAGVLVVNDGDKTLIADKGLDAADLSASDFLFG